MLPVAAAAAAAAVGPSRSVLSSPAALPLPVSEEMTPETPRTGAEGVKDEEEREEDEGKIYFAYRRGYGGEYTLPSLFSSHCFYSAISML